MKNTLLSLFFILISLALVSAQEASLLPIEAGDTLTLSFDSQPIWLVYESEGDEYISIISQNETENETAVDTVLTLIDPDQNQIYYRDDLPLPEGDILREARIDLIYLAQKGPYQIRLDSFNGVGEGQIQLSLTVGDPFQIEKVTNGIRFYLPERHAFELNLELDQPVEIIARDLNDENTLNLDPFIRVEDAGGQVLSLNDDHGSERLDLNQLDALVFLDPAGQSRPIKIYVGDVLGRSGYILLEIQAPANP